jgi:thiamine biosynthesis lipoprotein
VNTTTLADAWLRRARPLLGTIVEVGARGDHPAADAAVRAAFDAIADVQARLSRFESTSEIARFHAMPSGTSMAIGDHAIAVLSVAQILHDDTAGIFDISLGTAPGGWRCDGSRLHKLSDKVRLDLGGIAKGYAVDQAIDALVASGSEAGWINAGGDVRVFGDVDLPVSLRDEHSGGVRPFATLRDGAFATSHFGPDSRSTAWAQAANPVWAHASVAAPSCLWADALTKVIAISGDTAHPLLARYRAQGWLH